MIIVSMTGATRVITAAVLTTGKFAVGVGTNRAAGGFQSPAAFYFLTGRWRGAVFDSLFEIAQLALKGKRGQKGVRDEY
jgi:hypothetical protein